MPPANMADKWFAGLMTGTVLDGEIDIAFLRTDGQSVHGFGPHGTRPYTPEVRALLAQSIDAAQGWNFKGPEPAIFATAGPSTSSPSLVTSCTVIIFTKESRLTPEYIRLYPYVGSTWFVPDA